MFDKFERMLRAREDVVIGAGVDEQIVNEAAGLLGVVFPIQLREYLKQFGHVELGHFELFGLGDDVPAYLDLVRMTLTERTDTGCPLRSDLVPLLNDGGGNLYCITTKPEEAGAVVFWDHTGGQDQVPDRHASSLAEWLVELLAALHSE
ncbi:MAG: SMI1/KNR4 family protein [Labilithrix sp.]|nr:SMI1/KNR4 family protein [Labilithrix sp.]